MATSDEETDRGVAGGDPAEPSQPIRETEGRSETLTAAFLSYLQAAPRRMTLETRLGIATVTLLVFTFGLLVYRKVELHQQKLMQVRAGAVSPDPGQAMLRGSPQRPADQEFGTGLPQGLAEFAAVDVSQAAAEDSSPTRFPTAEPDPEAGPERDLIATEDRFSTPDLYPSSQRSASEPEFPTPAIDAEIAAADVGERSAVEFSPADEPMRFSPADETVGFLPADDPVESPTADSDGEVDRDPEFPSEVAPEFAELPEPEPEPELPEPEPVLKESVPMVNGRDSDLDPFADNAAAATSVSPVPAGGDDAVVDADAEPRMELAMLEPQPSFELADSRSAADATGPRSNPLPRLPQSDRAGTEPADGAFSLAGFNYQNTEAGQIDDGANCELAVVQEGDNYSRISKRVYGSSRYFSALAVVNQHRIPDPRKMRPGMKLLVPPREVLEARYPHLFSGPVKGAQGPIGFIVRDDGTAAYHVSEGDTLSDISARFLGRSSRWIEIFRLNQNVLRDPNKLKTGTVLELPADAVEVNIAP